MTTKQEIQQLISDADARLCEINMPKNHTELREFIYLTMTIQRLYKLQFSRWVKFLSFFGV